MPILFHGSRAIVERPEVRVQKYHKDFSWGFYCTEIEAQAVRWATKFGGTGVVNVYSFASDEMLNVKRFPALSDEWLDFVAACRSGIPHSYDVVEGPMLTMSRASWMEKSAGKPFGRWQSSNIPHIRSVFILIGH